MNQQSKYNYSQAELDKFNKMAPNWWDPTGPMKPLHQMNPIRTKFIADNINNEKNNFENFNILDVGCGGGLLTEELAKLGANLTGIDMSTDAINVAKLHLAQSSNQYKIDYQNISIEEFYLNNPNKKYDAITCLELLEHVPSPAKFIEYLVKILKPGGKLIVSTLNRNLKSYLIAIVGAEYVLNWLPKGTHEYNKFIKPSELAKILRDNDKKITSLQGITYSLLSGDFSLTTDTDVNYIACIS